MLLIISPMSYSGVPEQSVDFWGALSEASYQLQRSVLPTTGEAVLQLSVPILHIKHFGTIAMCSQ